MSANKFRYTTVTAVVIANMIGTGVFTSPGFQLLDIRPGFPLLLLWVVGGIIAVCGAYATSIMPGEVPAELQKALAVSLVVALTGWTLWFVLVNRPVEGLFGLGIIAAGLIFYYFSFRESYTTQGT